MSKKDASKLQKPTSAELAKLSQSEISQFAAASVGRLSNLFPHWMLLNVENPANIPSSRLIVLWLLKRERSLSMSEIAKAIDLYCGEHAAESKARFFEYLAVSALLKNGDAHLKNFSLLYDVPTGAIKLSPLYDVVSTIIYEIVNPKTGATRVDNSMALQMFKQKSFPVNAELIQFGKSVCMVNNPQDVIERIEEAKHFVMRKHANEMDPSLITKLKMAWRI